MPSQGPPPLTFGPDASSFIIRGTPRIIYPGGSSILQLTFQLICGIILIERGLTMLRIFAKIKKDVYDPRGFHNNLVMKDVIGIKDVTYDLPNGKTISYYVIDRASNFSSYLPKDVYQIYVR